MIHLVRFFKFIECDKSLKINLRAEENYHDIYIQIRCRNMCAILLLLYIQITRRNAKCDATRLSAFFGWRINFSLSRGQFTFAVELSLSIKRSLTSLELKKLYFGIEKIQILELL